MSDHAVTLSVERVAAPNVSGSRASIKAVDSRAVAQIAPFGQSQEVRKSSVRLIHNEELGRAVVQILDRETGEVIYQIPPEELQKLSSFLEEIRGSVVDELA